MRVAIQRGHYGMVRGETGAPGEMELNSLVAKSLKSILERNNISVTLINATIQPLTTSFDAFVAIHADSAKAASAHGFSVGFPYGDNGELAQHLRDTYAKKTNLTFRGFNITIDERKYYAFRSVSAKGRAIIELGFLSNPDERAWLLAHKTLIATTIAIAIFDFLKIEKYVALLPEDDDTLGNDLAKEGDDYR